ncbi:MAG: class I tRNA ligase family protein, partial [Candidatus Micrarchaeota archaeon]
AVMVCTFGDKQDVVWMYRHKLPYIKSMDEFGKLENAGEFSGLKVKEAKEKIIEKYKKEGKLLSSKQISQTVKVHDRCTKPIELVNSHQWFAKITEKKDEIISTAKEMKWIPEFAIAHLIDWANYIEWDWVVSRQRIFGTPIPFWHCKKCNKIISPSQEELPVNPPAIKKKCPDCNENAEGETSVFDCWFDSSITPLIISKWNQDNEFFKKTFPSSLRPQGVEIIRTWAFYTIYRCKELTGQPCFKEILLNGNVLAPDGKKMSKSLGNVIMPDKLIDEYGADSVRIWAALSGAMAKDRPFSFQDIKYAKSFLNKLLNAGKFVQKSIEKYKYNEEDEKHLRTIDKYFLHRLNEILSSSSSHWKNYEFHHIVKQIHDFFWHEFCDYYLEYAKYRIYSENSDMQNSKLAAQYTLYTIYSNTLLLLTPITPHSCEELWQIFSNPKQNSIQLQNYPSPKGKYSSPDSLPSGQLLAQLVALLRQEKASRKLALNAIIKKLSLTLPPEKAKLISSIKNEFCAVGRIDELKIINGKEIKLNGEWPKPEEKQEKESG